MPSMAAPVHYTFQPLECMSGEEVLRPTRGGERPAAVAVVQPLFLLRWQWRNFPDITNNYNLSVIACSTEASLRLSVQLILPPSSLCCLSVGRSVCLLCLLPRCPPSVRAKNCKPSDFSCNWIRFCCCWYSLPRANRANWNWYNFKEI